MSVRSVFKKMFSNTEREDDNQEGTNLSTEEIVTEESTPSSSSSAKMIVCQGAKCRCNQSETPTQIELKVLSQMKYYINDGEGSQKLIASTMDVPLPFDAPFFGNCKLKPSGSNFLPCAPALSQWQKPYENVELSNGGKILTEESTAMCTIGGTIKIEEHGQDPAQINESQVQNGTLAVATLLNPALDEADIEILAGGASDGDTEDQKGASVKKIATVDGKNKYVKEQWINFKVSKWYNSAAENKDKVNWIVYDKDKNQLQMHEDIGETFDIRFTKNGTYIIEAYGGSAGGQHAATHTVHIKNPELHTITKNVKEKIRPAEQATFTLAVDMPDALDVSQINEIQWAVYRSTNRGSTYTETIENVMLGTTNIETATFAEKGWYQIKATWQEKTLSTKLRVGANGITAIKSDKTSMRTGNDSIKFSVPQSAYSIVPPLEEEKQAVKWIVYDSTFNEVTTLSGKTGETFTFSDHKTEGIYYVEAYMNSSEIKKVKNGRTSNCVKKVIVTTPKVTLVKWSTKEGALKANCGYEEEVLMNITLHAFNNQKIKLKFYNIQTDLSKTVIAETEAIVVDQTGKVAYTMKFPKDTYKSKLINGQEKGTGFVACEVLPFNDNDIIKSGTIGMYFIPGTTLHIKSKEAVCGVHFEKEGKRVRNVHFDETITCHFRTYNLIGKKVTINLYRLDSFLYIDHLNPDDKIASYTATVDSQGRASFDVCVEEKYNGYFSTREKFYLELEDTQWYSKAQQTQGTFIAFTKKDILENQVNPVVVEESIVKNKNVKCIRCETDLITLDLEKVLDAQGSPDIQDLPINKKEGKRVFDYLPHLNKYMKEFGINDNCRRRGHFLGQVAKETAFWSYIESFNHSVNSLKSIFRNFKTTEGKQKADEWGYTSSRKAEKVKIANWAYAKGSKATELGNDEVTDDDWGNENADGYKYRGRGLVQLTGKANYKAFQEWYDKKKSKYSWPDYNFETNPEKVIEDSLIVALSAIYFWDKSSMNVKADMGEKETDVNRISNIINSGESDNKKTMRYENFVAALNQVREKSECTIINYTPPDNEGYYVFKNGDIKFIEGGKDVNYFVETEEGSNTFKKAATLTKNGYGFVKFPETGDGFGSYSSPNTDVGGIDTHARRGKKSNPTYITTEHQGKGDRYLLPKTAAALFGVSSELGILGYKIDFGDMSSENGSDPGKPGSHHSGHGHLGKRIGLDVDWRYLNSEGKSVRGNCTDTWFNLEKNKDVFDMAIKYHMNYNFTSDKELSSKYTKKNEHKLKVVHYDSHGGHKNHGHSGFSTKFKPTKVSSIDVTIIE